MNECEIDEEVPLKSRWPLIVLVIIDILEIRYSGEIKLDS